MVIQGVVGTSVWLQTGSLLFVELMLNVQSISFYSCRHGTIAFSVTSTLVGTDSAILRVTLQGRVRY